MSNTKHTPISIILDGANGRLYFGTDVIEIPCEKTESGVTYSDKWYAIAKLIAAAPEMLEALIKLSGYNKDCMPDTFPFIINAAIKKATE